jgi:hypothetical protein
MSEELEIESVEEIPEPERPYYVDLIELPELRRYVCLDLARMCMAAPDKTVKIAREMETFLLGNDLRVVK